MNLFPRPGLLSRRVLHRCPPTKSPTGEETYILYEGISNMWTDPETVMDHPALTAIYGLLPPPSFAPNILNNTILTATAAEVAHRWNFTDCWGWDFPMLAMNSVRLGDVKAVVAVPCGRVFPVR